VSAACALFAPGFEQGLNDFGRDRLLIKREPDIDREPALLARRCSGEACDRVAKAERRDLGPVGIGREAKSSWGRQPGRAERRQIGGLRPDPLRVPCRGCIERDDELAACGHLLHLT
jgi:hypothetical protein